MIVVPVSGDVPVAVSTEKENPIVDKPVAPYLGGLPGKCSSTIAETATYYGSDNFATKEIVLAKDVSPATIKTGSGVALAADGKPKSKGSTIDGDACCGSEKEKDPSTSITKEATI